MKKSNVMFTKTRNKSIKIILTIISFAGFVLTLTEIVLNTQGQSLCTSSSCHVVHSFDAYNLLNWLGLLLFAYLFFTSFVDFLNIIFVESFLKLRILIVTGAIIVEGYFIGIQTWFLGKYCSYCLTIASLIFLFAILDYYYQRENSNFAFIYGGAFAGALAVFIATALVNIPLKPLPPTDSPILIYKENCKHCKIVEDFAKKEKIHIIQYPVREVFPLMQVLGIKGVPVLIYKHKKNIEIICGDKAIINWFKEISTGFYLFPFQFEEKEGVCDITSGKPCK